MSNIFTGDITQSIVFNHASTDKTRSSSYLYSPICLKAQVNDELPRIISGESRYWVSSSEPYVFDASLDALSASALLRQWFLSEPYWESYIPNGIEITPKVRLPLGYGRGYIGVSISDPDRAYDTLDDEYYKFNGDPKSEGFVGFDFDRLKNTLLIQYLEYWSKTNDDVNNDYAELEIYDETSSFYADVYQTENWAELEAVLNDHKQKGLDEIIVEKKDSRLKLMRCTQEDIDSINALYRADGEQNVQYIDVFDILKGNIAQTYESLERAGMSASALTDEDTIEIKSEYIIKSLRGFYPHASECTYSYIPFTPQQLF